MAIAYHTHTFSVPTADAADLLAGTDLGFTDGIANGLRHGGLVRDLTPMPAARQHCGMALITK